MDVQLPCLFTGTNMGYDNFLRMTGLPPVYVKRVNGMEKLQGYRDKHLFYAYNFSWMVYDPMISAYCRDHGIEMHRVSPALIPHTRFYLPDGEEGIYDQNFTN